MLEKLAELIKEQLNYDGEVKAESNFKDDLGEDTLDLFELVMSMEEEYGVEIPSEDLEKIAIKYENKNHRTVRNRRACYPGRNGMGCRISSGCCSI